MACHDVINNLQVPENARKIVLAGNPNVGKSVLFNAFTGIYVDVSNYPGTTLDISYGNYGNDVVIDTPGIYGISSFNDEERVARDVILSADIIINIVDAVHLERDLFLTQQLIDTGLPIVVALNMLDEAKKHGIAVDFEKLSDYLGVPVVPTIATKKWGFAELKKAVDSACSGKVDPWLQKLKEQLAHQLDNQADALLILEGDPEISKKNSLQPGDLQEEIYLKRRRHVNEIVEKAISEVSSGSSLATRIGRLMIKPVTGIPILLIVLWLIYELIGVFIAQTVVGFTEQTIMQGYYEPWISSLIAKLLPGEGILEFLLVGEFGILTMTVTYIIGLLLPLVVGFYFILAILEDTGYLPRIATLVDRVLVKVGLNGRGVIPIILGFGCVTMATITTRLLGTDRERRIATFLLALAIPCSAQLAVIAGLLAGMGVFYSLLYSAIVFLVLVLAGTLLNRILPGESSDLLIDLPPLRFPRLLNILQKTYIKSLNFLTEAAPLFAAGALLIGILYITGLLEIIQEVLSPLTVGWLQLPKETANAFIMGFVRRDFGAAGLYSLALSPLQTVVALVTITIFVPCIASAMVIFKERGAKEAIIVWPTILILAFLIGGIVSQIII